MTPTTSVLLQDAPGDQMTAADLAFLDAIRDPEKRSAVISILAHAGLIPV
jgi:hypothetical protein